MIAAGAVVAVGSLSGLTAAVRVGSLERRLEALERDSSSRGTTSSPIAPRLEAVRVESAHVDVAQPTIEPVPEAPRAEPETLQDRWKAIELRAGTRWTSWLGAGALVIAAALLVKLAVEEGWLGPVARFALGTACSVGILAAGWRAHRSCMRVLAHGLLGAGLGVLYVSLYVASATHALFPAELAFGAMVAITIAGCVLAVGLDAQPLATLAWLGGLATPVLVPGVIGSRDLTCTYVLVLAIAGSTLAAIRQWQALALAAFAGSSLVIGLWLVERHDAAAWQVELAWLTAFHLAHHIPTAILAWRRAVPMLWRGLAFANAAVALGSMATIIAARNDVAGVWMLGIAALHAAQARFARQRVDSTTSHLLLPAIAMTTAAMPLLVPVGMRSFAWACEAVALVAILRDPRDTRLRLLALALLGFAALHVGAAATGARDPSSFAIIPAAAWSFASLHSRRHASERAITLVAAFGGLAFLLVAVSDEIARQFTASTARAVVPAVWTIGSLVLASFWHRVRAGEHAAAVTSAIAAYMVYTAYRDGIAASTIVLNVRFIVAVGVLAGFATLALRSRYWTRAARIVTLAGVIALVGAELHVNYAGRTVHAALSIGWGSLAGVLLAIGFARQHRALRTTGLGLLGVVALKLVVVDLAGAPPLLRVISFVVLGTVMIAASYGYHRVKQ